MKHKIAVLVGSLRNESFSRKVARALVGLSPPDLECELVEIGDLEIYNQDYDDENRAPASYRRFREQMRGVNGVLFVTPEYNRSIPGVLKNALDVGSRPYGQSIWDHKPGAIVSNSPGAIGGFGANHHLRQCLVFLNVPVLQQPEVYLSKVNQIFADDGSIGDERTRKFLADFMGAFAQWVNRLAPAGESQRASS